MDITGHLERLSSRDVYGQYLAGVMLWESCVRMAIRHACRAPTLTVLADPLWNVDTPGPGG